MYNNNSEAQKPQQQQTFHKNAEINTNICDISAHRQHNNDTHKKRQQQLHQQHRQLQPTNTNINERATTSTTPTPTNSTLTRLHNKRTSSVRTPCVASEPHAHRGPCHTSHQGQKVATVVQRAERPAQSVHTESPSGTDIRTLSPPGPNVCATKIVLSCASEEQRRGGDGIVSGVAECG